ncbi:Sbal_3080 family lipoprotein [Marinobacter sp. OP 3.4]|uniref:Sbal_3080 family lipoprotein n=1 Tax=Marinobacter sp. OP 3.4 TaxID=3076501 RepID=UPI002E1C7C46
MIRKIAVLGLLVFMSGCSITQKVEPVASYGSDKLCVIENDDVREGFLDALESSLAGQRIDYTVVDGGAVPKACQWTLTYTANWRWDLAIYMAYAEIKVFEGRSQKGGATYDAMRGGANMNKFIDAEDKIRELVNELFGNQSAALYRRFVG